VSFALAIPLISKFIDRLVPDPGQKAEAQLNLMKLAQQGDLAELDADVKLALGQMEINKEEARSGSWWVAGWRPFIGWVSGTAVAWNFVIYPTVTWAGIDAPPLDISQLMVLLLGMLGIGGMRSFDKRNKVDTQRVG